MGRTLATVSGLLERERARWQQFRRALRREDQRRLDALLEDARRHLQALAYASWATPYEAILVAVLLEERRRLEALEARLQALEQRMAAQAPSGER